MNAPDGNAVRSIEMSGKLYWHRNEGKKSVVTVLLSLTIALSLSACGQNTAVETELSTFESEEKYESSEAISYNVVEEEAESVSQDIYVYICGAVESPGVYKMPEGSRIFEVLEKAGGLRKDAAEDAVNQALLLSDGDRIKFPTIDELKEINEKGNEAEALREIAGDLWGTESQEANDGRVNINTASAEELTTISGIGETRAEAIISYRESNGAFASIDDIKKVAGIKDGLFLKIKDKIRI